MTARSKASRLVKVAVGLLLLVACVVSPSWYLSHRPQKARRHWKDDAIPAIASRAEDKNWRAQEIEVLTNRTTDQRVIAEGWLTDKMILMKSGEWLVYKSHSSKEQPHLVRDIFLAKGSDGKWYYSTFHFCVGMCTLLMEQETQPANLAEFVHEYNLREFDGRSDECLKETIVWGGFYPGEGLAKPAAWGYKLSRMFTLLPKMAGTLPTGRFLERLEPCEGKLSCTVLRGA